MAAPLEGILETALYADDLDRAEAFYGGVLGLEKIARAGNRHVFFRCGPGVLLIFNPAETVKPPPDDGLQVPPHGTKGQGHACFRVSGGQSRCWTDKLKAAGIAIESEVRWPNGAPLLLFPRSGRKQPGMRRSQALEYRLRASPNKKDTMRKLEDKTIVVASHNAGKIREIRDLIGPLGFAAKSAADLNFVEPEETGTTFEENATIKALASAKASGLPALSDDSGLVVDALGGDPGVYTANWAETADGTRDFAHGDGKGRKGAAEGRGVTAGSAHRALRLACSALPGRTAMSSSSAARSKATSSGRRAARRVSATIRSSSRSATTSPSAK